MKKIVIFGTGGFGQLVRVYLSKDSPHEVAAFTVHEKYLETTSLLGLKVVAFEELEQSHPPGEYAMAVAVGYAKANRVRAEIYSLCKNKGYELISYVSSKAIQWGDFELGDNSFVLEGAVVSPFARIGNDVVVTPGVLVSHHSSIGDHAFLGPHAVISGSSTVGEYALIGANATVADGIHVGPRCVVSAGAVVNKNTGPGELWYAEPGRRLSTDGAALEELARSPFFRH